MLADGRVTQSARTDFTGYRLTGVQADTNGEFDAVATVHPRGNDLSRLLDPNAAKHARTAWSSSATGARKPP